MNKITGYQLYKRVGQSVELESVERAKLKTREEADRALEEVVDETCIRKFGEDNFVKGQLSDPKAISGSGKTIYVEFTNESKMHVVVTKKIFGTFYGSTDVVHFYFGIMPVYEREDKVSNDPSWVPKSGSGSRSLRKACALPDATIVGTEEDDDFTTVKAEESVKPVDKAVGDAAAQPQDYRPAEETKVNYSKMLADLSAAIDLRMKRLQEKEREKLESSVF
jgi:hypothetical protein